ncbi:MAG: 6-carboxytetrahydropterin synthase QueD [Actinobacteria bacterium]|nr:6-carboxytetrahydropterin synthase QueD [Actinomycetota bacterium]
MKTSITKICTFAAAHSLPGHQGKCRELHGHTYTLEVTVKGGVHSKGPAAGMVLDFADLERLMRRAVVDRLDHSHLNEVLDVVPTVEAIAGWAFARLTAQGLQVVRVRLWESPTSYAEVTA